LRRYASECAAELRIRGKGGGAADMGYGIWDMQPQAAWMWGRAISSRRKGKG